MKILFLKTKINFQSETEDFQPAYHMYAFCKQIFMTWESCFLSSAIMLPLIFLTAKKPERQLLSVFDFAPKTRAPLCRERHLKQYFA